MDITNFGEAGHDWEDSKEQVAIGTSILSRYCRINEIVNCLCEEGSTMNYLLLSVVLLCLPSISSPSELCDALLKKFQESNRENVTASVREQVQMKVMVVLRFWARSMSVYCDFSGPVIETALDLSKEGIQSECASVVAAARRVRAALKLIRDDLRDIDKAQTIYRKRVDIMRSAASHRRGSFSGPGSNSNNLGNNLNSGGGNSMSSSSPTPNTPSNLDSSKSNSGFVDGRIASQFENSLSIHNNNNNNSQTHISGSFSPISEKPALLDGGGRRSPAPANVSFASPVSSRARTISEGSSLSFASVNLSSDSPQALALALASGSGSRPLSPAGSSLEDLSFDGDSDLGRLDFDSQLLSKPMGRQGSSGNNLGSDSVSEENGKYFFGEEVTAPGSSHTSPVKSMQARKLRPPPLLQQPVMRQPKGSVILSIPHHQLASWLTILEFEDHALSIRPREFIQQSWTKTDLKSVHPDLGGSANLSRAIYYTNQAIAWVAREIIDYAAFFGPAAEALEYFIRTAKDVLEKNNFNTFFQIVSALCLPAIRQLKAGWNHVASKKKQLFERFTDICNSNNNYSNYRRMLSGVIVSPHIVSLQILIKDIVGVETSGPWRSGGRADMRKAYQLHSLVGSYLYLEPGVSSLTPYDVTINANDASSPFGQASPKGHGSSTPKSTNNSPLPGPFPGPSPKAYISEARKPSSFSDGIANPGDGSFSDSKDFNPGSFSRPAPPLPPSNSNSPLPSMMSPPPAPTVSSKMNTPGPDTHPKPSFLFNIRVARDSFFDPLHEDYQYMDQQGNFSVLTPDCHVEGRSRKSHKDSLSELNNSELGHDAYSSPMANSTSNKVSSSTKRGSISTQNSPVPSPYSPPRTHQPTARAKIRSFFKKLIGSSTSQNSSLEGADQGLAELQSHIWSINPDLNSLFQDAKSADKVETKRLVGRLASAGLY